MSYILSQPNGNAVPGIGGRNLTTIQKSAPLEADALIFDVDGVLLDTEASFPRMIEIAVQTNWRELGGIADCAGYSGGHNRVLKRHGAFNDDYDIAWMLSNIAAARIGASNKLSDCLPSPAELERLTASCATDCVSWVESAFGTRFEHATTRARCEAIYLGGEDQPGTCMLERPLSSVHWRELPLPVCIYTGRNLREWRQGQKILKWQGFPDERVVHFDTGMRKPAPDGLEYLCNTFGLQRPIFFGDTMSDKKAHVAFGKGLFAAIGDLMPQEEFCFASVNEALSQMIGWEQDD